MRTNKACIVGRFKKRGAVELLEYMVKEGGVEWESTGRAAVIVYWRKPEECANVIYELVIVSAPLRQGWENANDGADRSITPDRKVAYSRFARYLKGSH